MSLRARVLGVLLGAAPSLSVAAALTVTVSDSQGKPFAGAVVLAQPQDAKHPVKPLSGVEIRQAGRQFQPMVTVIPVGTAVEFPNQDTVRHHVYSFSAAKRFELKLYVGRPERPVLFDQAGVVVLGCNIHDHMAAWIVVADTPWYGQTDSQGQVRWPDLPPGRYVLRVWHQGLPAGHEGERLPLVIDRQDLNFPVRLGAG